MLFYWMIGIVIIQRLIELVVARRNERWMKNQGAIEAGTSHYRYMVAMHVCFFASLLAEVFYFDLSPPPIWRVWLGIFLVAQVMRVWCLVSLGKYWNTKIIVLPGAHVVRRGPYKWIRHPNYVIVATELLVLPLLFNAYFTAILFTLLNIWMMAVRIPEEEEALKNATNYRDVFSMKS
ncbi:methyltransferase [Sporosarcina luteola]|nr:methyltransferase [Sporosarcina luteola]